MYVVIQDFDVRACQVGPNCSYHRNLPVCMLTQLTVLALPQMVQQLSEVNWQQLVGEVTGALLLFPDPATTLAAAHCFKPLLCAVLSLTSVKPLRSVLGGHYNLIHGS